MSKTIELVVEDKKRFLDLLLLADEQEDMIDRYLERGALFVLREDGIVRSVAVVTLEGGGVCELKNLATRPQDQRKGYGRMLLQFLCDRYRTVCRVMLVGTGDSPLTLPFYRRCGFVESHRVSGFFTEHYRRPIYEGGVRLRDMVYLKKEL